VQGEEGSTGAKVPTPPDTTNTHTQTPGITKQKQMKIMRMMMKARKPQIGLKAAATNKAKYKNTKKQTTNKQFTITHKTKSRVFFRLGLAAT